MRGLERITRASVAVTLVGLGAAFGSCLIFYIQQVQELPDPNTFHEGETEAEREARYAAWKKAADAARLRDWEAIQREIDRRCLDHVDGLRKELSPERG